MEKKTVEKPIHFEELVQEETIRVFEGLLRGGGPEFKGAMRIAIDRAIQWRIQSDKYERQQKKIIDSVFEKTKKKLCPICQERPAKTSRGLCRTCSGAGY